MKTGLLLGTLLSLVAGTTAFAQSDSDRVDLKKLEAKYWEAKDSDYAVVQNRTYSKVGRPFLSASYGALMNDSYSTGRMTNFALGYYFSERWGLEVAYENGALKDNDGVTKYRDTYGVQVDYNKFVNNKSLNLVFVPLYAKASFMDFAIVYFDLQFAAGIGQTEYEIQMDRGNEKASSMSYNFDVTQQLFFHKNIALRMDIKNKWSTQDRSRYQLTGSQTEADRSLGSQSNQDTTILLGVTLFY